MADLARRVFEPLGWGVEAEPLPLDPQFPDWGESRYVRLRLTGVLRLADALNHLYMLLPVLDDAKHYWVAADEVDKLVRAGSGWLAAHPERGLITRRYLRRRHALVRTALQQLAIERLADADDTDVDDLGCGEGALLAALLADRSFSRVVGADVSFRALQTATRRLRLDRMPERTRDGLELVQTALTYRDGRLAGFDAAVLMEVVEHLDPSRLPALEETVLGAARPRLVVVTTPNLEYNARYELEPGRLRHTDHRFEWTRAEFRAWADGVAERRGYGVTYAGVGDEDADLGHPTQLAVFTR